MTNTSSDYGKFPIHFNTLRDINASLDAEYCYFEEERSSLDNQETLTVNDKSESSKDKTKENTAVVVQSKDLAKKDNANEIHKRSLKNELELNADQTEHFKQFEKNINCVSMWGKPIGMELDYKWKINNPRYGCLMFVEVYTWFHILYTQYWHISNGDFSRVFEVFALYGIGAAAILTTWVNSIKYKEIVALLHFTRKICLQNGTGARGNILKSRLINIYKIFVLLVCSGFLCVGLYAGYPIMTYLMDGEFASIMPIKIMFVDQSTFSGFFIANLIMTIIGVYTVLLLLFVNLSFLTTIFNYSIQVDMIKEDIKELNVAWNVATIPFTGYPGYQQICLRNICQKQQDMNSYMKKIKEIYDGYIFIFFVFSYASQIICMFEIITSNWISGYGIAFGIFICQMIYCLFGTIINIENDRLYNILLNFKWYNSDLCSQKMYLQLLTSTMDSKELWIGVLAPLNVITAIQIVKSMYSYYTVLMEFA